MSDDLDYLDAPLTLQDYIEIVTDDLDEAAGNLTEPELEQLCRAIRKKIVAILGDVPDKPADTQVDDAFADLGYRRYR